MPSLCQLFSSPTSVSAHSRDVKNFSPLPTISRYMTIRYPESIFIPSRLNRNEKPFYRKVSSIRHSAFPARRPYRKRKCASILLSTSDARKYKRAAAPMHNQNHNDYLNIIDLKRLPEQLFTTPETPDDQPGRRLPH